VWRSHLRGQKEILVGYPVYAISALAEQLKAASWDGHIGGRSPKLTPQQHIEIIRMVSKGIKSAADITGLYGVHPATISRLPIWSHARVKLSYAKQRRRQLSLDSCVYPVQSFSVSRAIRSTILVVLVLLVVLVGALNTMGTLLCVGPGNHYHLEMVIGGACGDGLPASRDRAPRPRDGCPRGSKDYRLAADTHRSDNTRLSRAPAAVLVVLSGLVEFSNLSQPRETFLSLRALGLPHSTIVLRC
jgi:hypothetical protein